MKTKLSLFDNSLFSPGGGIVKRIFWYLTNAIIFRTTVFPVNGLKIFLLRVFGCIVGKDVHIKPCVNIKYPWKLKVGNAVWIGENVWIDNLDEVIIKDNVCISQGAMLLTGNHNYKKTTFDLIVEPIKLEEGVWVGAKSTVCPGVTCKSHSVLTVGSVATKDLEAYSIYQGVPAIKVKDRKFSDE